MSKVYIIDSKKTLNEHKDFIIGCNVIGVDLEGRAKIGGGINLIQFSCKDKIFIFDILRVKMGVKDIEDPKDEYG